MEDKGDQEEGMGKAVQVVDDLNYGTSDGVKRKSVGNQLVIWYEPG